MVVGALRNLAVLLWIGVGVYVGIAGYVGTKLFETTSAVKVAAGVGYFTYSGLSFATRQDLQDFLLDETVSKWMPWLPDVPAELMPLLACAAWGALGTALRLLYFRLNPEKHNTENLALSPIFGAGMALAVYFLAFLLPAVLTVGPNTMRAETLVALSILSGIAHREVYVWVQGNVNKLMA